MRRGTPGAVYGDRLHARGVLKDQFRSASRDGSIMGWLTGRTPTRQVFEDGIRWVEAIKNHTADAEEFASWAMRSPVHVDAFHEAWVIWHDVRDLPGRTAGQSGVRTARVMGPCGTVRRPRAGDTVDSPEMKN
jgi:hypothetical protein